MAERTTRTSSVMRAACAAALAVLASTPGTPGRADGPTFSLSVTPTRLIVPAGQLGKPQEVRVTNPGKAPLDVEVGKRDFVQQPDGSLAFQPQAPYSASNWVQATPARFRLQPGAAVRVKVAISLPDQPDAGDHQVVMVFLVDGHSSGNIRINRGVGLPVYLTAPGPTDDSVRPEGLRAPRFAIRGPIRLTATVRNVGTVHRDFHAPAGLAIRVAGGTVPFPDFTVTRGAVREIRTAWADPPLFCVCRATMTLTAADGTAQVRSARIVIVPLHLIAAVVGGGLLIFLAIRLARRRYRASVQNAVRDALGSPDGD